MNRINTEENIEYFDRISSRYEKMNGLISCGLFILWDQKVIKIAKKLQKNALNEGLKRKDKKDKFRIADIGSGTGRLLEKISKALDHPLFLSGIDPSKELVKLSLRRRMKCEPETTIEIQIGRAEKLSLESGSQNLLTSLYTIRNWADPVLGIREVRRVLGEGGVWIIVDFFKPEKKLSWRELLKVLFLGTYIRYFIPCVGFLFGLRKEYAYLYRSIINFYRSNEFRDELEKEGFRVTHQESLIGGIPRLLVAEKIK